MAMRITQVVMESLSPSSATDWVFTFSVVLLSLLFLVRKWRNGTSGGILPPSPPKLPIIGNLHQLGGLPHRSLWKLSRKHGPIMFLKLGSVPTFVVSSADAAEQVLRTRDSCCCSRPQSPGPRLLSYDFQDLAFTPYSDHWKEMRKLFATELLGPKRAKLLWHAREVEVGRLISSISQASPNPVDLTEKVFHLVDDIIGSFAFGKRYEGKQFGNQKIRDVLVQAMDMLGSFSAEDFFPSGGWIVDAISGLRAKRYNSFHNLDDYFQMVINDHLDPTRPKPEEEDLVDVFIGLSRDQQGSFQFTKDHIKAMLMNTFIGATTTTAATLVWTMAELMANPRVMKKLQTEVRSCVGRKPRVEKDDVEKLKYSKMVIKETLRKHTPVPLLVPRETMEYFKIHDSSNGKEYEVHPRTRILVNAWAIGRDPKIWNNPDEYYPERFEKGEIEFDGKQFQLIPFGGGRRICPGANAGATTAEFTLANLIHCFDWELPGGMKIEDIGIDDEESGGLVANKKTPLCLVAKRYGGPDGTM